MAFTQNWDYRPTNAVHADSPGVYTSDKILNSSTIGKIHLKCDVIDGSVANGIREPRIFSFVLDKPPGYKVFCEPETILYRRINKNVLKIITFFLENDNDEENSFNGEPLTFTLQKTKISTIKCAFKNLKVIVIALEEDIDPLLKTFLVK